MPRSNSHAVCAMEQGNEIERIVRHCDLAKVLRLADELKHQKLMLKTLVSGEEGRASHVEVGKGCLLSAQFVCFSSNKLGSYLAKSRRNQIKDPRLTTLINRGFALL